MNFQSTICSKLCTLSLIIFLSVKGFTQPPHELKLTTVHGIVNEKEIVKERVWVDYTNEAGAFTIKLPGKPQELKKEIANSKYAGYPPYMLNMYLATDCVRLVNHLVRYNDYPSGMYLADRAQAFTSLIDDFKKNGKIVKEPVVISKDGIEGRSFDVILKDNYFQAQTFIRGNRIYLLLKQSMGVKPPMDDDFFTSFRFEKYTPNKGVPFSIGNIEIMMPDKPRSITTKDSNTVSFLNNDKVYYAVNHNSGGLYGVENGKLSKYARIKKTDSMLNKVYEHMGTAGDTLYKSSDIVIGNLKGKEYYTGNNISGTYKRMRIWFNKDQFYYLSANGSEEEMLSAQVKDFFNSIKYITNNSSFNLQSSKAALIVQDLKSKDTLTHKAALDALSYYQFEKDELPHVYAALKYQYHDDTSGNGTKAILIKNFRRVNDQYTLQNLKDLYKTENSTDVMKVAVLSVITDVDSSSYDWYFNSLTENIKPLRTDKYWSLFKPLSDSLPYAAAHLDKLLPLLDFTEYRTNVLGILTNILDIKDKPEYTALLENRKELISARAISDLDLFAKAINTPEANTAIVYQYLYILPKLKLSGLADEFTKKVLTLDSIYYLRTEAVVARIKAGLPVENELLMAQLDSLDSRFELLYAFNESGKIDEVPLKYRKPDAVAKLLLRNYLVDDYGEPNGIELIGAVKDGTNVYYSFAFSYIENEVKNEYIGICGPFSTQTGKLDFDKYLRIYKV